MASIDLSLFDAGDVFTPPPAHIRGFIFDCDGTLADTMPLHFEAWRHALQTHGASFEFSWSLFVSRAGMSLERTVDELNLQFSLRLDANSIASAQRCYFAEHRSKVQAVVPVVEYAKLAAARFPISVASGNEHSEVQATLALIDVPELFPIIITPRDVVHGKPAPDMFLLAAERMGVPAARCAVFEDAELGLEAARRAGMLPVRVTPTSV